jgi:hypothetical protein
MDTHRPAVAVHELAHWFAWTACGFRIMRLAPRLARGGHL